VWATKYRIPYLTDKIRGDVISHIYSNAMTKGIYINQLNGYSDHLHALISMGGTQNISEIMQNIKGESSHWINKNKLTRLKFKWQNDFYCVSIGETQSERIRKYIQNQEQHHKKIRWDKELEKLIKENNLMRMTD
jgi:REP element-mobilizing transposase RayT